MIFVQDKFASRFKIPFNFDAVKGKNGSAKTAKAADICKATNIIVCTRSASTLIIFQGSSSAKYLFPSLAKFINSWLASLNLYLSIDFPIIFGNSLTAAKTSSSISEKSFGSGTIPV